MKKAVIVGALPLEDYSFLKERKADLYVACDGGYKGFLEEGIEPDLFVGDFDTLEKDSIHAPKKMITLPVKKDDTDVFYAVKELLSLGYDTFEFYGCLGGKIDHTFANIQVLAYLLKNNAKGYLFSENNQIVVHMIRNSCIRFKPLKCGFLSVFSYNGVSRGVDIENFMYTLKDAELSSDVPLGISNQFISKEGRISVQDGTLLLVVPKDSYYESRT